MLSFGIPTAFALACCVLSDWGFAISACTQTKTHALAYNTYDIAYNVYATGFLLSTGAEKGDELELPKFECALVPNTDRTNDRESGNPTTECVLLKVCTSQLDTTNSMSYFFCCLLSLVVKYHHLFAVLPHNSNKNMRSVLEIVQIIRRRSGETFHTHMRHTPDTRARKPNKLLQHRGPKSGQTTQIHPRSRCKQISAVTLCSYTCSGSQFCHCVCVLVLVVVVQHAAQQKRRELSS